jgi:hypothetical protein
VEPLVEGSLDVVVARGVPVCVIGEPLPEAIRRMSSKRNHQRILNDDNVC